MIVSDSCHSSGLIDEAKGQIGESTKRHRNDESESGSLEFGFSSFLKKKVQGHLESRGIHFPMTDRHPHHEEEDEPSEVEFEGGYIKNKSLPLSTLIEILKKKTGKDDIDVGKIRPTLFDMFGKDSSPKVKKFMKVLFHKLQGGSGGLSNAIQTILRETEGSTTNHELVTRAREIMKEQGFTQHSGLYCSDDHANVPFIC